MRLRRADMFHSRQWSRGSAALSTSRVDAPLASTLYLTERGLRALRTQVPFVNGSRAGAGTRDGRA